MESEAFIIADGSHFGLRGGFHFFRIATRGCFRTAAKRASRSVRRRSICSENCVRAAESIGSSGRPGYEPAGGGSWLGIAVSPRFRAAGKRWVRVRHGGRLGSVGVCTQDGLLGFGVR